MGWPRLSTPPNLPCGAAKRTDVAECSRLPERPTKRWELYSLPKNKLPYNRYENLFPLCACRRPREVRILQRWMPYFKVSKEGAWQIYDIERHELVGEESFTEVLTYNDTTFVLESDAGNRYLILPECYGHRVQKQPAVIADTLTVS